MKNSRKKVLLIIAIVMIFVFAGCATPGSPETPGGVVQGQESAADTAGPVGPVTTQREEGPPQLEIDYSGYQRDGGALLDIHTVRITIFSRNSGRVVYEDEWRDSGWHSGQGNQETPDTVWDLPDVPDELLEVKLEIGSNHSFVGLDWFDSFLTFGPVEWDLSAGENALIVTPYPWTETGALTLRAVNESGIGNLNHGLGVFLENEEGTANYHFHLQPGGEYLRYEGHADSIKAGTYQVTVMASKDDGWPYYGNAVWEGPITVSSGSEAYVSGVLAEKIAPWDLNIGLADFGLQNESTVYETSFDALDPQMEGPHTYEQEEPRARLENGTLVVSGDGNLSGGMNFNVQTGANSVIRVRARMPEGGAFFTNLRRWGSSRVAVIFATESEEEAPSISTFSTTKDRTLAGSHSNAYIPELNSDQWYDYTLIDTGDELFIFIDDQYTLAFPVANELPASGHLGLEWHRPCSFDSLAVSVADDVFVPASIANGR
ncbi:MAG: hypothetical protein PF508_08225 [Spirochaeta sp.]|jgi:hypothetical protein|nr:hypothetical protein [Spirochaeta sp.]